MANWGFIERVQGNMKTRKERWIEVVKNLANELNERLGADGECCHNMVTEAFQRHSMTPRRQTSMGNVPSPLSLEREVSEGNRDPSHRREDTPGSVLSKRN